MFFNDLIQRRLVSLLRPWLEEPELELKLGFLRSRGTLKNLKFNTSALNQSLDDSTRFRFKEVTVQQISLCVSYWSSTSFTLGAQGLRVVLLLGEEEAEGGSLRRRRKPKDTSLEDKKRILDQIDSEGSVLHDAVKRISEVTLGSWKTNLLTTVLGHSQLEVDDIHVLLLLPGSNNSYSCSLKFKELGARSIYTGQTCFLREFAGSFLLPSQKCSFDADVKNFEVGLRNKSSNTSVVSATDISSSVTLENLRCINFVLCLTSLRLSLSSADLAIISIFYLLSSTEATHNRTGSQLWRIAASKISSLISAPKFSLYKVASFVDVWLCYIHSYEKMLLLIGYPVCDIIKKSAAMMFSDRTYSNSIKRQWDVISEFEYKLNPEAIALARQIIRNRVSESAQLAKCHSVQSYIGRLLGKVYQLLALTWSIIYYVLNLSLQFLFLQKVHALVTNHGQIDQCRKVASDNSFPSCCICLSVGKFRISVSADNGVMPAVSEEQCSAIRFLFEDSIAVHLSSDTLFLRCFDNLTEDSFMFSCGCIEVFSSSLLEDSSDDACNLRRDHREKEVPDSQAILWLDPAQVYTAENHVNDIGGTSVPLLELILGRMWLNWKNVCSDFLGNDSEILQSPCILLESRHFLVDPSSKNITSGIYKGGLVVGRLHFMLEYSSIVSLGIVFGQIQHALYWDDSRMQTNVCSHTSRTPEGLPEIDFSSNYKSFARRIGDRVHRMCPEKQMEVGVAVTGPEIQLSLRKKSLGGKGDMQSISKKDELLLSVNIDDIELLVSPNSGSDSILSCEHMEICDEESFGFRLKETQNNGILKSENDINSCKRQISLQGYMKVYGLKASLSKLSHNSSYQFFMLRPATAQSASLRKDCHSLGSTIVAVSTALHWMASGFTALVFLDDMFVLVELVFSLKTAVVHALSYFSSNGGSSCQELFKQEMAYAYSECDEILSNRGKEVASPDCIVKHFAFKSTCELGSMDMVLYNSRKCHNTENYRTHIDGSSKVSLDIGSMSDSGVHLSVQQACATFSFEGGIIKLLVDFTGVRSDIIKHSLEIVEKLDQFDPWSMLSSLNCLCEASFSHCKWCLQLNISGKEFPLEYSCSRNEGHASMSAANSDMLEDSLRVKNSERSTNHSCPWLCTKIFISEIYLGESSVKNILAAKHSSNKLEASLSVGGQFQAICCQSKGGSVYLETTALFMFVQCIILYKHRINDIWSAVSLPEECMVAQYAETMVYHDCDTAQDLRQVQHANWDHLEALSISLSQLSLAIVVRDDIGRFQELLIEADVRLNLEVKNMLKEVFFEVSKFSILSQFLNETLEQSSKEIQIPHFSSITHNDSSFASAHGDCSVTGVIGESSSKRASFPQNEFYSDKAKDSCDSVVGSQILNSSPQNYLLKEVCAFIAVECPVTRYETVPMHSDHAWVGNGSVSDFDMTISLTEILAILVAVESLSGVLLRERTNNMVRSHLSLNQESEGSLVEKIPDDTIVAIEDVHQHMYIAVENSESRHNLVGTMHYSLVGERSLFRVKHHNQGRWKPQTRYFSLISLYAKDESGQPLRLNSRPKSDFVDISGSYDSAWTSWTVLPYRPEVYDGDSDLEPYHLPAKNTFYLANKKNDRALAFIDGVLEFVAKPGNPFKFKLFSDFIPAGFFNNSYLGMALESGLPCNSHVTAERDLGNVKKVQGVTILINKVTLTIVHELADTKEKFPLLQGTIGSTDVIVQMLNTKARFMCRLEVMLHHFDAQRNIWRELVHPLDICIFYRYRFLIQGSENDLPGVHGHLHVRIKELGISLTELSLDILLFIIGKLKVAGPFAVRNSAILANCCKVENRSGLTLQCQFFDNQYASVAGQQSTAMFLRHLALANQPPEASVFSIRLADQGALSTSLLHLSLLEARAFAWRTRVISSQESKTSPGPFIVVEVSRRTEEGLSIVVSPLLRIHNETDFSMELRFQRPQERETEYASLVLESGDSIDDSVAAFGATNLSGGLKRALMSLSVGNFLFSFRPRITDELLNCKISSVEWSDDLKGGKPVHLSSLFEKLAYQVWTAFSAESSKCSFGTAHCALKLEDGHIGNIYYLIQSVTKDVPVIHPDNFGYAPLNKNPPIALQEQKEIFLLPTVCVSNLLQTEIYVNLADADPQVNQEFDRIYSNATIPCGAAVNLYANPATIFFMVTLTAFDSSCKPVNSSEWIKNLQKQKNKAHHLDIELDFGGGKYFAFLRLSRGHRGTLEAAIFTAYSLHNDTNSSLFCIGGNLRPLSRVEVEKLGSRIPPELGVYLPPKSTQSWFMKCHKVFVKLVEEKASEALLDLDSLSGLTEIDLEVEEKLGVTNVTKLGVSLKPAFSKSDPTNMVYVNPRHVILNQSGEVINIRQSYVEDDDMGRELTVRSKQRIALKLQKLTRKKDEMTIFEKLVRKHTKSMDDPLLFVQFQPNDSNFGWSGPVCVASLGQFFLKFRRLEHPGKKSDSKTSQDPKSCEFASVHVVEEDSTLVLHFYKPPNVDLPYQIQNCLRDAPITYYQQGSSEPDTLGSGCSVNYVWDDLTLPHKLLVQIDDIHIFREINLDKVRAWRPFYKTKQQRGLGFLLLDKKPGDKDNIAGTLKLGYEVFAEGLTRVLRICEFSNSHKRDPLFYSTSKMRFRISYFSLQLLEYAKQEKELGEASIYAPIISTRLENVDMSSMFTYQHKVNQINIQSLAVDQRWVGAPFSAVLRRCQSDYFDPDDKTLRIVLVLLSSSSMVKQIKYLSIILQPLDLNLDEETLMRIVPFWRTSLSDPNAPSQLYYFDHFEIHPIKIMASFLPRESYASYSSTQEMMRSLLHSVIKIPAIKKMSVELNGVLVTHALITLRQLSIKCAQHYSWYALRAIYIAKGSPLLPPAFASIFDDFASSSLDVFFDPSSGLLNFPGLTMGTFKLISKCIDGKGFSGTKRYFGDLGKTLKMAGSNIIFAAITELSDSVLKGAETNGFNGMVHGFHQGILKLAMEPSFLGIAVMEGGPDRKIKLDRSPGVDELYIEGYLQALLDTIYKQEYLRVRVVDNHVILKNLPPNSSLINEITERVKGFLVSKALLKGDSSTASQSLRHIRGETEWKIGPTVLTLCEHLFVSFAIRILRRQARKVMNRVKFKEKSENSDEIALVPPSSDEERKASWRWGIGKFVFSGIVAYVDGRLCRCIPNPIARRVVSGFLLSFLENDKE